MFQFISVIARSYLLHVNVHICIYMYIHVCIISSRPFYIPVAYPLTRTTSLYTFFCTLLMYELQSLTVILFHALRRQSHSVSCVFDRSRLMSAFIWAQIFSTGFISGDSAGVLIVACLQVWLGSLSAHIVTSPCGYNA